MIRNIFLVALTLLMLACKSSNEKIELIERSIPEWVTYQGDNFTIQYVSTARVEAMPSEKANGEWINILYPKYKLKVYCTYLSVNADEYYGVMEDNFKMLYNHKLVASGMTEELIARADTADTAILFELKGMVATPIQFLVADTLGHFFRGSLYYDEPTNLDSVAPITQFVKDDMTHLIRTIEWVDKK